MQNFCISDDTHCFTTDVQKVQSREDEGTSHPLLVQCISLKYGVRQSDSVGTVILTIRASLHQ